MDLPDNIEMVPPSDASSQNNTLPLPVISIQQQSKRWLTDLLEACFAASDFQFMNLADKAKKLADQEGYFYAMRELYLKKKPLIEAFFEALDGHFSALISANENRVDVDVSQLNLTGADVANDVENSENSEHQPMLDRSIAFHKLLTEELAQRFSTALASDISVRQLPLSPFRLCSTFITVCKAHDIPKRATNVLFKLFERVLMQELGTALTQFNSRLEEMGVQRRCNPPPSLVAHFEIDPVETQHNLNTLIGAAVLTQATALHRESSKIKLNATSEIDATNAHSAVARNAVISRKEYIIARTLTTLSETNGIAAPLVPLLKQLQKPLALIAQHDKAFFSNRDHAARRLVNALSTAALAFGNSERGDIESDRLFIEIKRIIAKLRDRAYTDSKAVGSLADEFEHFIVRERRGSELFEQRLLSAVQGKQHAQVSQKGVRDTIAEITQGLALQSDVRELVDGAWYQVMFVTALKQGIDSAEWDSVSQTLTDLVIGTQPYFNQAERARGLAGLEELKQRVRMGLESISFDPPSVESIIQQLDRTILGLVRDEKSEHALSTGKSLLSKDASTTQTGDQSSKHELESVAQAKNLAQGSWMDLTLQNGQEVRCRLAAIIGNFETYLFVDRNGGAVAEKSLIDVAEALTKKRLTPLLSHKIFDIALKQVIGGMKQMLASA